jgi:hypothetical protein
MSLYLSSVVDIKSNKIFRSLALFLGNNCSNGRYAARRNGQKLALPGSGEGVSVDVHLRGFDPIPGELGPLLAVITVQRTGADPEIAPLLAVDIESVEAEPGY